MIIFPIRKGNSLVIFFFAQFHINQNEFSTNTSMFLLQAPIFFKELLLHFHSANIYNSLIFMNGMLSDRPLFWTEQ